MHELGIANSVLETVRAEARSHPGAMPVRVGLRVGALSGVNPEALTFAFEALTKETEWEGVGLEIESTRREHRCPACQTTFLIVDYDSTCFSCGNPRTECISGEELEVVYVELEEP